VNILPGQLLTPIVSRLDMSPSNQEKRSSRCRRLASSHTIDERNVKEMRKELPPPNRCARFFHRIIIVRSQSKMAKVALITGGSMYFSTILPRSDRPLTNPYSQRNRPRSRQAPKPDRQLAGQRYRQQRRARPRSSGLPLQCHILPSRRAQLPTTSHCIRPGLQCHWSNRLCLRERRKSRQHRFLR
jgi:hypothetical protein